jgi:beta-galactosidase
MRNTFYSLIIFLSGLFVISCANKKTEMPLRTKINFGNDWQFKRDSLATEWEKVNLPHTARIEPLVVNDQWQGTAMYQKTFEVPKFTGQKVFLYFEGVMHEADVWINGTHKKHHVGGYLPFTVDATDAMLPGRQNLVEVKVNNQDNPDIPPGKPLKGLDFNYYGGIYRNVYLITTNKIFVTDAVDANKPNSGGVLVRFDNAGEENADGLIQIHLLNESDEESQVYFNASLEDSEGNQTDIYSAKTSVKSGADLDLSERFTVENPELWSPQHPHLYNLEIELFADDKPVDQLSLKVGIRNIGLADSGFFINGEKQYIRGTNRHQEYPYVGYALSDEAQYRDVVKIKNAGFDFVRLSHYPQSEAFMNACDELGILVMNCIPGWQFLGGAKFVENSLQDCRDMIRRDRNHPSVVFWEVSLNETQMQDDFIIKATNILKTELPYSGIYSAGWVDHPAFDLFIPARQHGQAPEYWNFYKEGKRPVFIAEYGDWEYYAHNAGFDQAQFADLKEDERTSRQLRESGETRLLQQAINFQEASNSNRKGISTIGDANWLMFDYNRGYTDDLEASGISDIFRIPKFAHYFYQSQRPPGETLEPVVFSGPMVKIATYWTEKSPTEVKVYSNCDEVELYLNDELVSKQKPANDKFSTHLMHPPFVFKIEKFVPGTLKAMGYSGDEMVVEDIVKTPGIATAINIDVDFSSKPLSADFPDVVFVYSSIVDENGTIIPDAATLVTFSIEGEAGLIGENPAPAKAGIAAILLRSEVFTKPLNIHATAIGLKAGSFTLEPEK